MSRRPGLTSAPSAEDDVRTASPAGFRIIEDGAGIPEPAIGYGSIAEPAADAAANGQGEEMDGDGDNADERSSLLSKESTSRRVGRNRWLFVAMKASG